MKFEKLTRETLIKLKSEGYNLLVYNKKVSTLCVTWFPQSIENIYDHLINLSYEGDVVFEKPNIIIIDYMIENAEENDLYGYVFIDSFINKGNL